MCVAGSVTVQPSVGSWWRGRPLVLHPFARGRTPLAAPHGMDTVLRRARASHRLHNVCGRIWQVCRRRAERRGGTDDPVPPWATGTGLLGQAWSLCSSSPRCSQLLWARRGSDAIGPGQQLNSARRGFCERTRGWGRVQTRSRSRCRRRQGAGRALGVCECSKCSIDARGFDGFVSLAPHVMASELVSAACGRRPRDAAER